jgi:exodeoxyribonuclease-5
LSERLFLCATSRLAQTLRGEIPGTCRAWRTRPALTIGQWLAGLADEALVAGIAALPSALDPFAERLLWEKVIAASLADASPLFDLQGLAASARKYAARAPGPRPAPHSPG